MRDFTDLSLDLETLGTEPGAVITQIGLAAFNSRPQSDADYEIAPQLIHVDPQSCLDLGMHVSWATIAWWLIQDEAPRQGMALSKGLPLYDALASVSEWCALNLADGFKVWGNGATFDVTLLDEAYRKINRKPLWQFRNVRDMRTLVAATPEDKIKWGVPRVAHDAMCDAIAQAETIRSCFVS